MATPRNFGFINPRQMEDAGNVNWENLISKTDMRSFDPSTTGWTGITSTKAYYFTFGPLFFFVVNHNGADIQWLGSTAGIVLPITPIEPNGNIFPIFSSNYGGQLDFVHYNGGNFLASSSGWASPGLSYVSCQGWYFRG